mmetsp:Transcript_21490/g.62624  ORF Transcript_21490/g.62624 Transcript_21490/m.62624 type:complete len:314 (-) Transcript_21490:250-1191(-)|eukprot:CAMPEP_0118962464 /NCGR_PEP_ID=MMETSP1173-20130426/797_1 /TAXON_ID=1034831 /ORGANISM="Rhizochromulina marina cf, Strain CCMP1243" /LENGTH=313 /DNA_ID=CAMNT_0006910733 /DNA_START=98 /DNA_END=1039 /DNA_ORIENTATION=+
MVQKTLAGALGRAAADLMDLRTACLAGAAVACLVLAMSKAAVLGPLQGYLRQNWVAASSGAFLLNVALVSFGGRFDSNVKDASSFPWATLVSPAGFAFAIWGIIYTGELVGVAWCWLRAIDAEHAAALTTATPAWVAANVAQSMWCLAFRPWALNRLWLSTLLLGTTAVCLLVSQMESAAAITPVDATYWAVVWPRSLHLGWTTAATLVNMNAWIGYSKLGPSLALAVALLSVSSAAVLGTTYLFWGLPTATGAVAWALNAVSSGTPVGVDATAVGSVALSSVATAERALAVGLLSGALAQGLAMLYATDDNV